MVMVLGRAPPTALPRLAYLRPALACQRIGSDRLVHRFVFGGAPRAAFLQLLSQGLVRLKLWKRRTRALRPHIFRIIFGARAGPNN